MLPNVAIPWRSGKSEIRSTKFQINLKSKSRILDDIGNDEKGRRIEIRFGALAMQEWGIELDLENERLDLSHYSKEFLEF